MNAQVNAIAGRMSLRAPQRRSLEILHRLTELIAPGRESDPVKALEAVRAEYPTVTDFERDFPSVCFALATGVGKTRLMGAFISYLHLEHGIRNFFVLAPGLTVYNKLIADFTPNTPKYVFEGIGAFASQAPQIVTGDNYEHVAGSLDLLLNCKINIFNIAKINTEVRGGRAPRIKRLSEYLGQSYFDYLAGLDDLVLLMDESHRYRASAGVRAINELRPVLGLELTATPYMESSRGAVAFRNIVFDYPLSRAMSDGFVKEPAVVTRKDFDPSGMSPEAVERLKLEDGVRLHESIKAQLETYAGDYGVDRVKPFILVIARDTTHAGQLKGLLESEEFFDGRYAGKVIQIDSSRSGAESDEFVERLLKVEQSQEPTEIVIHVNMLKEGWDVKNLYTIVPLRAASARVLIEQSIGRGLRLPYGRRTGIKALDRLSIVAHDRFQEIVDEANRSDSPIHLERLVLDPADLGARAASVTVRPRVIEELMSPPAEAGGRPVAAQITQAPLFDTELGRQIGLATFRALERLERSPDKVPATSYMVAPQIIADIAADMQENYRPAQLELEGIREHPDLKETVGNFVQALAKGFIDIPRIQRVPKGAARSGFKAFAVELGRLNFPPPSDEIWIQHLRTSEREVLDFGGEGAEKAKPENLIVAALSNFDDVAYEQDSGLLYDLAGQAVTHLRLRHSEDELHRAVRFHLREIAGEIHRQMQEHTWEEATEYETKVSRGFAALKPCNFAATEGEGQLDFRRECPDKARISRYIFAGFERCGYDRQKFESDPERRFAVILDRDSERWFRPAPTQFDITYRKNGVDAGYHPDFVAETDSAYYMVEVKSADEMEDAEVLAKKAAAVEWCGYASDYAEGHGGKPWVYVLIPHTAISENMTLAGLVSRYRCSPS